MKIFKYVLNNNEIANSFFMFKILNFFFSCALQWGFACCGNRFDVSVSKLKKRERICTAKLNSLELIPNLRKH